MSKKFHGSCSRDKWISCNLKVSSAEAAAFLLCEPAERKKQKKFRFLTDLFTGLGTAYCISPATLQQVYIFSFFQRENVFIIRMIDAVNETLLVVI